MRLKHKMLNHIMIDKSMKLRRLQELTGISKATLSAVKNGKTCSFATAAKIAKALDVDVMELIEQEV